MNNIVIERLIMQHLAKLPNLDKSKVARVNQSFTPPRNGVWVRVTLLGGVNFISGMADVPCTREVGTLVVQVFDRLGKGTADIKTFCDELAKHLAYYTAEQLELLTPSLVYVGTDDEFIQYNVSVPYRYN